jgi:shikimate kinase
MKNIILIGMPASGKSTVGVILAKILGMSFMDTDLLIQQREGMLLRDIIEQRGVEAFLQCEEEALLSVEAENTVIATGGSAVYSEAAMEEFRKTGTICYLKVERDELFRRLKNIRERGVVLRDGEDIVEMYENRSRLYEKYADIVIPEKESTIEETVQAVERAVRESSF